MKLIYRVLVVLLLMSGLATARATLHAQQPAEQQDGFVSAESLPQREQMPAAPLLIAAYAFVMLALFVYVLSVSRRVGAVKADMARLEGEIKRGSRA